MLSIEDPANALFSIISTLFYVPLRCSKIAFAFPPFANIISISDL